MVIENGMRGGISYKVHGYIQVNNININNYEKKNKYPMI